MSNFSFRKLSSGFMTLVAFLSASLLSACAQSGNSAPAMSALVAREIAVLELVGGGTRLTAAERQQAAEAVADALRGNREVLLKNYADLTEPLQRAAKDHAYAAGLRGLVRYAVEEGQPAPQGLEESSAIERRIIRAHDPTVVFDPARKHLITEASLRDFRTASGWLAGEYNLPAPSDRFTEHLRDWFRAEYLKSDKDLALMLAKQSETFPSVAPVLARVDPQRKEAAFRQIRQQLQAADPTSRDLALAASVAMLGSQAKRQTAENAQSGLCTGPGFNAENTKMCQVLISSVFGVSIVHGINSNSVYDHDLYHQAPVYHGSPR